MNARNLTRNLRAKRARRHAGLMLYQWLIVKRLRACVRLFRFPALGGTVTINRANAPHLIRRAALQLTGRSEYAVCDVPAITGATIRYALVDDLAVSRTVDRQAVDRATRFDRQDHGRKGPRW